MSSIAISLEVDDKGSVVVKKFSDKTVNKVKQMSDKSIGHVQRLSAKFAKGLGGAVSKVGRGLMNLKTLAMGALAGWGVTKVLGEFATFESALVDMGKVTGESFDSIKKKVMELPSSLGSATALTKGYYQVISAGVKGAANQMETLITTSKLAKTAHVAQAEVVAGLTSIMDAFGVSSGVAADTMQTMEKTGKTTVGALVPIIGELSSGSAALGISMDAMGAAFAAVTLQSGGTEKAATQYKALLTSLLAPTAEMTQLLSRYGGAQQAIKQIGFGGVLKLIQDATKGNATETKKLLGSVEGYLGFLGASAGNMATYNANLEEQKNKTGAVDKAWKAYQRTLNAIWDTFKNTIGKQVILIGEKLAPVIKKVTVATGKWLEENRGLVTIKIATLIEKITGRMEGLYAWVTKNYEKMKDMAGTVKNVAVEMAKFYVIAKVVGGLTAVVTFFQGMTLATGALAVKTALLNKAMKGNLLILMGYGAYKAGEFLTNWQMGIDKTKKDIEEWTGIQARLEAKLLDAQIKAQAGIAVPVSFPIPSSGVVDKIKQQNEEIVESVKITAKEQIQAMIKVAESDKSLLTARLSEYEKFYSSLQSKITATANLEKRHIQELNALYRQKADIQKSAAEMTRGLREAGMSLMERYRSQESALNQQYFDAMRMSGQEQIKALEEYKRAAASFAGGFRGGVTETSERFGAESTRTIVESSKIVDDAVSNIERATMAQQRALECLAAEKEKQISADRAWGATLTSTARDVAGEIEYLQDTIGGLSSQIEAMQKIIDIDAIDNVSPVVDRIQRELDSLHDKTITITTIHRNITAGSGGSGTPFPVEGSYAYGTDYVPRTGLYELHKGEKVTPEKQVKQEKQVLRGAAGIIENDYGAVRNNEHVDQSITKRFIEQTITNRRESSHNPPVTQKTVKIDGDIVINIPESAAPQRPEDWREITRSYIKPELERLAS